MKKKKAIVSEEPAAVTMEKTKSTPVLNRYWKLLIVFGILVLTVIVYSSSLNNGFIYFDDPEQITDNYSIFNHHLLFSRCFNCLYIPYMIQLHEDVYSALYNFFL